jgi:hypothetical protein
MTQLGRRWSVGRLLVVVLWLLGALLQIQEAYAAGKKVSITGKLDAIQSRVVMAPGDNPQHEVTLTSRRDVWQSADPDWNNIQTHHVIYADVTDGTGTTRGNVVQVRPNGDKTFTAFEGMVKTVTKPDGSRAVMTEGKWWLTGGTGKFTGITGGGTYKGTPGAAPAVEYEVEGEYEIK